MPKMDQNDESHSYNNTEDLKNDNERLEQEVASNNIPEEISDKMDSKSNTKDEKTSNSHKEQSDCSWEEIDSCKLLTDICIWRDFFEEDDDWDIYPPLEIATESPPESQSIFEKMLTDEERFTKNNSKGSYDYDSCKTLSCNKSRKTNCSPSASSDYNEGTFSEWSEKRMMKEVKEYFLMNPVKVNGNPYDLESKKQIIMSPYFSRDFAQRHSLTLPIITHDQEVELMEDSFHFSRLFEGYKMINKFKISKKEFFIYIAMDFHRPSDTSSQNWRISSGLDPSTICDLDYIQREVGYDIFPLIYKQITSEDKEFLEIFVGDEELLNDMINFLIECEYEEEMLREKHAEIARKCLPPTQAESTSDVISGNIPKSPENAGFLSTTSRSNTVNTSGPSSSNSNSYNDSVEKTHPKIMKTNQSTIKSSKDSSMETNKDSQSVSKKYSFILQSTNQDTKSIRSSFDSFRGHLDQSNDFTGPDFNILQNIQNSADENDEESRENDLVKSNNSLHHRPFFLQSSDQIKRNSKDNPSRNSCEDLQNVSNVQPVIRKCISQDDGGKSRKKMRLKENSDTSQSKAIKEASPMKDKFETSSQGN